MTRHFAFALALVAVLAAPATAGSGPNPPAFRVEILVDGRALPQYPAMGTRYVEALKGKDYAIRLHNPFPVRVAVALSVDGLNTIDARHTDAQSARKWIIDPYDTITIGGWQTSLSEARRFYFTSEAKSYANWIGHTADQGIISAVFYRERVVYPLPVLEQPLGRDQAGAGAPAESSRSSAQRAPAAAEKMARNEAEDFAATGAGRETTHRVRQIQIDLEDSPSGSVDIRYEYRPQLVKLGVLPPSPDEDPLMRRQGARGFTPGFCPMPKQK